MQNAHERFGTLEFTKRTKDTTTRVRVYIDRAVLEPGESEPAARGIEIHQILATYINHLARTTRTTDLEVFDALMRGVGADAREVLEKFRDNHTFDPEKILATELHIALDENFVPIEHPGDDGQIADYEGTLDLVMLHSLTEAEIDDWKSYYQVIEADTFQSKFYPLLLMCLNPSIEHVKFVLEFVRYGVFPLCRIHTEGPAVAQGIGTEGAGTPKEAP